MAEVASASCLGTGTHFRLAEKTASAIFPVQRSPDGNRCLAGTDWRLT